MKKIKIAALVASLTMVAGVASAADIYAGPKKAMAPPVMFNWAGAYVGVQAGVDSNTTTGVLASTQTGFLAGVYGGYNFMLAPSLLLGLDLSINYDWARGTAAGTVTEGPDYKGFVRGRLGWAIDKLLIYGTGGAAYMHYVASAPGTSASAGDWGWTVGGGAEMALSAHLTGRLDYAYQNYGSATLAGTGALSGAVVTNTAHTVTGGVAFKY